MQPVNAQVSSQGWTAQDLTIGPFKRTVAEQVADQPSLAGFYQKFNFEPLWTGATASHQKRRDALVAAIDLAEAHGLPGSRYQIQDVIEQLAAVQTEEARAAVEVKLSELLMRLSQDLKYGMLKPRKVIGQYKREVPQAAEMDYLSKFSAQDPDQYFRDLLPKSVQYARLFRARQRLMEAQATSEPGRTVTAGILRPGAHGDQVEALRDRLITLGYLRPTDSETYDEAMVAAVRDLQSGNGLQVDGVAGPSTLAVVNRPLSDRLRAVLVAMERERWLNRDLGATHVLVNLTDFTARLIVDDHLQFETRAVIGKAEPEFQTPEFSDQMEFIVINPTWTVPRSIAVNEYLPRLKRNRNAVSYLDLYNRRGQKISRAGVNFNAYTEKTFPFVLKQPSSPRNALGRVKFMFPNRYNIYLHDTPSKDLFLRHTRAYSHGCIRLQKPYEFAEALLALQTDAPRETFERHLNTGKERRINLKSPIPIHLIYRSVYVNEHDELQFYPDIYGRDEQIWAALERAGVQIQEAGG